MPAVGIDAGLYEGSAGPPQRGGNKGVRAHFAMQPLQDAEATAAEGRPIFRDVEFVTIQVVGDKTSTVERPATEKDRQRFPQEYALFRSGDSEQLVGTPLREWPAATRAQVEELAYFKVRTVEQLAEVSDGNLINIGPIRELRKKAQDWLEAAKGHAPTAKLRAELDEKDKTLRALQAQVDELRGLLNKKGKQ